MDRSEQGPKLLTLARGSYHVCGCGAQTFCPQDCGRVDDAVSLQVRRRFERVWLCRCGYSAHWPRCDGSHNRR